MDKVEEIIDLIDSHQKKEAIKGFMKYIRRWPWFVLFCILGLGFGYIQYKQSPPVYKISSRLLVKNEESSISSVLAFDNGSFRSSSSNIENQIGILQSYTLYRKALNKLNWKYSWFHKGPFYSSELYNNPPFDLIIPPNGINAQNITLEINRLSDNQYHIVAEGQTDVNGYLQSVEIDQTQKFGEPFVNEFFNFTLENGTGAIGETFLLRFNNINSLTSEYLKRTSISSTDDNSDLILVTVEGQNKQKEADFINELNRVFIEFGMQNKYESSENSVEFIDSQLKRIKTSLSTAENNFSAYRRNNKVMNLGQEAQLVYTRLEEIEQEQYLTQLQIDYYTNLQKYLDDSKKIEEMVNPSVVGITDNALTNTLTRLMELYSRREVLRYSVQDKNPTLIMLEKEIKIARDGLEETLNNQLQATIAKKESLQKRYDTVQERLKKLPDTEKQLVSIQREFDLNNELYTYMLQKKAEASISKASIAPEVQVIDEALVEAAERTGPNLIVKLGTGLIAGVIIPFIFITLLSFFNNKIETLEDVEKLSDIPVFEGIVRHKYKEKLPVVHFPRSGVSECFRGIKSNVNAIFDQPGPKIISINSLVPGEGKSFISSNLSAALSKANKKVLLIGADLHKPTLHLYLDIKESIGLCDFLSGEKNIEDIITTTIYPNLSFIQAGDYPENPSDLLDSSKLNTLFDYARKSYDYIVIDNAPLMLIPDTIVTSRLADVSLFIVRVNQSHKDQVKQINKIVGFNKLEHAAIVINDMPESGYGYGYYGNRRKYWKKGYGEYKHKMSIA